MTTTKSTYLALLAVLLSPTAALADPITVDFDEFTVTCCYVNTTVGGTLDFEGVQVSGGVVMNSTGWADLQTSGQNLYGSATEANTNFGILPGEITLLFENAIDGLILDIINGTSATDITLSLFDASDALIGSITQFHGNFGTASAVNNYVTALTGIKRATITDPGYSNIAIDTIIFDSVSVPEPGTLALLGLGLVGMGLSRRRRKA
jgi:hypothetical protein